MKREDARRVSFIGLFSQSLLGDKKEPKTGWNILRIFIGLDGWRVPSIRPLETLHNALTLKQVENLLLRVTEVPFTTPQSSPTNSRAGLHRSTQNVRFASELKLKTGETEKSERSYIASKDCIMSPQTMAKMHSNLKETGQKQETPGHRNLKETDEQKQQTPESSVMETSVCSESDL
ncbi:hypothetical protein NP493_538g05039 [Ridgeia piscesae]|uniref:Uncharacterized protein n=1 Tax=Ridgeia piscesae TaxID=27915 RepID=A0AAD9KXA3_RIDPI|nr:hypothetical protein NP493_538g05039 [Ridgeia piscesae]